MLNSYMFVLHYQGGNTQTLTFSNEKDVQTVGGMILSLFTKEEVSWIQYSFNGSRMYNLRGTKRDIVRRDSLAF